ncbi:MAG: hypothetical protein GC190_14450 [Alphaproteobacteria bacterium]|nr:hypothetical protein [Alphaproteobacteria bacterium]
MRIGALLLLILMSASSARAEELAAGLSRDDIKISSSFTGTDLVLFGAIESEGAAIGTVADRDVVVVVRGPNAPVTVRRKERLGPIWINRDQRQFVGVPSFYFVASTKPLQDIGDRATLDRYHLGLAHLDFNPPPGTVMPPADYRAAILRQKARGELYSEQPNGVQFISGSLFRTTIALPSNLPSGTYDVNVYLFRKREIVTAFSTPLRIGKTGVERWLFKFAADEPWIYGLLAVMLAGLAGWISSLIFRQRQ